MKIKLPFVLRKTYEEREIEAIKTIKEMHKEIAVKKDELKAEAQVRESLKYRNETLCEDIDLLENKVKQLEEYIEKLEKVSENKTLRNCSLNTKLIAKDAKCKELDKANKKLISMFNDANRRNWCNNESSRQLKKLAEDILESDKINKTSLASYIHNISMYVGGGVPIEIQAIDEDITEM